MKKFTVLIFSDNKEITRENILIALSYQFIAVNRKQIKVLEEK